MNDEDVRRLLEDVVLRGVEDPGSRVIVDAILEEFDLTPRRRPYFLHPARDPRGVSGEYLVAAGEDVLCGQPLEIVVDPSAPDELRPIARRPPPEPLRQRVLAVTDARAGQTVRVVI